MEQHNWVVYVNGLTANHSMELNTLVTESDSTAGQSFTQTLVVVALQQFFLVRSGSAISYTNKY